MSKSKAADKSTEEIAYEQAQQLPDDPKGEVFFFPNLDPELPAISVEAKNLDDAQRKYETRIKESK